MFLKNIDRLENGETRPVLRTYRGGGGGNFKRKNRFTGGKVTKKNTYVSHGVRIETRKLPTARQDDDEAIILYCFAVCRIVC